VLRLHPLKTWARNLSLRGGFSEDDSVWFGDGQQGIKTNDAGNQTGLQVWPPKGVVALAGDSDSAGGTLRGPPA
jgi:hypothetical protein